MGERRPVNVLTLLALVVLGFLALHHPPRSARADTGVIQRASLWNAPAATASSNLLATSVSVSQPSALRITAVLAVSGTLSVVETNGTTTLVYALNGGVALTAYQAYTFTIGARVDDGAATPKALSYNFRLDASTNGSVPVLRVDEVQGGVD